MSLVVVYVLVALVAYLIGSIPSGYLVVRLLKGTDVREVGSGRTGGTNAMRAGGLVAGLLTAISDVLKGVLAVVVGRVIAGADHPVFVDVLAGLLAVVGHNWSIYMRFKGGAGTAPNIGASMVFWPLSGLYLLPMIPFGLFVIGYASVTSMIVAALVVLTFLVRAGLGVDSHWWYVLYGVLAAASVLWALRPNIQRLREGREPMIGPRAKPH